MKLRAVVTGLAMCLPMGLVAQNASAPPPASGQGGPQHGPRMQHHRMEHRGDWMQMPDPEEMDRHHGAFWMDPSLAERLALTPDQLTRLNSMQEAGEISAVQLQAALDIEEIKLHGMRDRGEFDQHAMDAEIDKVADARAALEKADGRLHVSEEAVLTPEQWKMLHQPMPPMDRQGPMGGAEPLPQQ